MCGCNCSNFPLCTRIYSIPLSYHFFVFFVFVYSLFFVYIYMIVCFTLDVNCEERRRSSNVRCVYNREEELTRDKRETERTINLKERKRSPILFFFILFFFCLPSTCLYVVQIVNWTSKSHFIYCWIVTWERRKEFTSRWHWRDHVRYYMYNRKVPHIIVIILFIHYSL